MNKPNFGRIDSSFTKALERISPTPIAPHIVFGAIKDDPKKITAYVQERTGKAGDELALEVMRYSKAMEKRNG